MELRNISKSYHGRPVLQNVSFTIEPGVTALWAPSGAGKTTLLRILLGLERPDSGELLLGDIVLNQDRIASQAAEYGHPERRELAFLVAHSMLHLFGYDHMEDEERVEMERRQKEILEGRGYFR